MCLYFDVIVVSVLYGDPIGKSIDPVRRMLRRVAMCMQTPDAILIDFYGTICSGDRQAVEETCRGVVEQLNLSVSPTDLATRWGGRFFATIEKSNGSSFKTLRECETQSLRDTLAVMDDPRDQEIDIEALVAPLEAYWRDPPIFGDAIHFLNTVKRPVCCVSRRLASRRYVGSAAPLSSHCVRNRR